MTTRILPALGLAALVALAATLPAELTSDGAVREARVGIEHFAFLPEALTVPAGTTVTWTNRDDEIHTVTAAGGAFASPALERGEAFAHTFTTPGAYDYFCALHPKMKSTITVR